MLVQVEDTTLSVPGLPPGVLPIKPEAFSYNPVRGKRASLRQFPVTVAYAITDYKCQGKTYFKGMLCDLQRPKTGSPPSASLYVQISRVPSIQLLSVIRPFDASELHKPLSPELLNELEWQAEMAEKTAALYTE
jgi:hypothetical protein